MDKCKVIILSYSGMWAIHVTVFIGWILGGYFASSLIIIERGELTYLSNYGEIGASIEAFLFTLYKEF